MFKTLLVVVLVASFSSQARADHTITDGYQWAGGSVGAATGAALGWGACRLVFSKTNESDVTAVRVSASAGQTLLCLAVLMGGTTGGAILGGKLDGPADDNHWDESRGWQLNSAVHGSYTGPMLAYSIAELRGTDPPGGLVYAGATVGSAAVVYGAGALAQWLNPKCGARGFSAGTTMGSMFNVIIGIPLAAIVDSDRFNPKVALGMAVAPLVLGALGSIFCS